MKVKRLTKKQKLFWADLQGRVGEHVVKYGRPEEIAIAVGEELSRVNNNDELNKRVDQYLNAIMDRDFPPIAVVSIMRAWLAFYWLSIDPNKLTTSHRRFRQRYHRYIVTSRLCHNTEQYYNSWKTMRIVIT